MNRPEPIVSIGADVDVAAVIAEIQAEVQRKLDSGAYPPEIMGELEVQSDPLSAAVDTLRQSSMTFALEPPIRSHRPVIGKAVQAAKRSAVIGMRWYTTWLAARLGEFAVQVASTSALLADTAQRLEADAGRERWRTRNELAELRRRVEALEARLGERGPEA